MNDQRLITLAAAAMMFGFAGCKSGQFASDFAPEIEKDCYETVVCLTKVVDSAKISACINKVGENLGAAAVSAQQEFIDTVSRCQEQAGCAYTNCASSASTGFSVSHGQWIAKDCQEKVACEMTTKTVTVNAVAECIAVQDAKLESNPGLQAEFQAKIANCGAQVGCGWAACK